MYSQWLVTLRLLELGISWDAIQKFTEDEISVVLAIVVAKEEHQAAEQANQQRARSFRCNM